MQTTTPLRNEQISLEIGNRSGGIPGWRAHRHIEKRNPTDISAVETRGGIAGLKCAFSRWGFETIGLSGGHLDTM
jgi:hypothetical protein